MQEHSSARQDVALQMKQARKEQGITQEMLAEKVCRVFSDGENQTDLSAIAAHRHDPLNNNQQLLSIYHKIIGR